MLFSSRQFVFTFIVSCALLLSSVTVGVKASEVNWNAANQPVITLNTLGLLHPMVCAIHSQIEPQSPHHCCASICLMKMPCGQSIETTHGPLSSLALIGKDDNKKAITRVQTLFRPPISLS